MNDPTGHVLAAALTEHLCELGRGRFPTQDDVKRITVRWLSVYAPPWLARHWGVQPSFERLGRGSTATWSSRANNGGSVG